MISRHPDLFEADLSRNLAFAYRRHRGPEGAEAFAARLVTETGTLVLPAGLWRSSLGTVPDDRLRISLGQPGTAAGLESIDAYLHVRRAASRAKSIDPDTPIGPKQSPDGVSLSVEAATPTHPVLRSAA